MPSLRPEIVGRDDELAELAQLVEEIVRDPRHVVLQGEPGIGKTILWRHTVDEARAAAATVLVASPSEAERSLAHAGLRDLIDEEYDDVRDRLPPPRRRALDVALLRSDPRGNVLDQGAIAAAFLATLRLLADRAPVLVAVDDWQWLDEPSRFVVDFAARRLAEERVSFLLAVRAETGWEGRPGVRASQRITLKPLSVGALHRIVRTQLGTSPTRPELVRLHELSGGNPFFALEIARALGRRGSEGSRHEVAIPSQLQDLVSERLRALPPETVEALQIATALSHPTVGLVMDAVGGDARVLDPAVAADVISTDGDRLVFAHPLIATAAYASAGPARRREIHARLAALVGGSEEEARHLALAATGPNSDVAAALERAADQARARGASTVAADLAERAHRMTPENATTDRLRRAIAAGGSLFDAGDAAGAATLFEQAVAAAHPGPARADALAGLGRALGFAADLREAAAVYRQAIAESEPVSRTRAEAEHGLAVAHMRLLEDLTAAARHVESAVQVATKLEEPQAVREFSATRALIRQLLGDPPERGGSWADWDRTTFLTTLNSPEFMEGVLAVYADDLVPARASLGRALALATERGDEASLPLVLRYLSFVELLTGDWKRAEALTEEGYEAALLTGQRSQQAVLAATRALIAAHRGDVVAAPRDAEEALRLVDQTGSGFADLIARSALGLLELSLGDAGSAAEWLEPLLDRVVAAGAREPGLARFVPDLVEAWLALGRVEDASTLLASFEAQAVALGRPSALTGSARCRAILSATQSDFDAALGALDTDIATPFERARALLVRGGVERRARRKRAAREALEEAGAVFEELGARAFAKQARAELRRIGGRAPAGDALTPTELRVAALVAEGRSTKEVAASLFVSPKTVEGHLSRIYAKLGVHSRTALSRELSGA
jgi:DNA-binding CsgD family transcriptional regulator